MLFPLYVSVIFEYTHSVLFSIPCIEEVLKEFFKVYVLNLYLFTQFRVIKLQFNAPESTKILFTSTFSPSPVFASSTRAVTWSSVSAEGKSFTLNNEDMSSRIA